MLKQPQYKIARRLGTPIFSKCDNPKFILTRNVRSKKGRPRQLSEFGVQLLEKQKARYLYGLKEHQFHAYVTKALAKKGANPVLALYTALETRLDNVVYRLGFAKTRAFARQMVTHGHITVGGKRLTIPSYQVKKGDVIGIRAGSQNKLLFNTLAEKLKNQGTPPWLSLDVSKREGTVVSGPALTDYSETIFNLTSIIEFYSR